MKRIFQIFSVLITICSISYVSADLPKEEEREINAYRLTLPKVSQFAQATKNLVAAVEKNPTFFDAAEKSKTNSLAEMIDATNKIPEAKKAIEAAGMTAREYWMFQMAMIYAGTGAMVLKSGGQLPAGFSKENVEFYQKHETEFMKLDEDLKAFQEKTNKAIRQQEEQNEG